MPLSPNSTRAALVVAHPSHELRIHGWLEQAKPYVCVLTDGAGRSGEPRLHRTSEVLFRAGATPGAIYGRLTDLQVYEAILNHDCKLFAALVEELAQAFFDEQIDHVVGDAAEGYSVTHDLCRIIIGAAVELAASKYAHQVANFDFLVVGSPDECPAELRHQAIRLHLDDETFERKVNAARGYSPKLGRDVEAALAGAPFQGDMLIALPLDAFRVECLRPAAKRSGFHWTTNEPLFYESYGERQVAAGHYQKVIRYREHILPLAEAIRAEVKREEHCVRSAY